LPSTPQGLKYGRSLGSQQSFGLLAQPKPTASLATAKSFQTPGTPKRSHSPSPAPKPASPQSKGSVTELEKLSKLLANCSARGPSLGKPSPKQLSPLVTLVSAQNPGELTCGGTNTYFVGAKSEKILVDTGEGKAAYAEYLDDLVASGVVVVYVALTHGHDHVAGGLADVRKRWPDVKVLKAPGGDEVPFKFEEVADGESISVPGVTLIARHSPGHSPDHCCWWLQEDRAWFTGDCVRGGSTTTFCDLDAQLKSLAGLIKMDALKLYPCHGRSFEGGGTVRGYLEQMLSQRRQMSADIVSELLVHQELCIEMRQSGQPVTVDWLLDKICKELARVNPKLARQNLMMHLKWLEEKGRLECLGGEWRATLETEWYEEEEQESDGEEIDKADAAAIAAAGAKTKTEANLAALVARAEAAYQEKLLLEKEQEEAAAAAAAALAKKREQLYGM